MKPLACWKLLCVAIWLGGVPATALCAKGEFGGVNLISTAVNGPTSVFAVDVDGDGDTDVLSSSDLDDDIAWYENTNGLGTSWTKNMIWPAAFYAQCVFAADLDGDGDPDVLSASGLDDTIAWYENTNGTFGTQRVITTAANYAVSVYAADLDGDGDLDVLSTSTNDDELAWYENLNGLGNFGPQQVISTAGIEPMSVRAADLDGDGDADVLCASASDGTVAWFENLNGLGSFGPQQVITTLANNANSVSSADLDGDGDMDVLSASVSDGKVAWYENTNGLGSFGPQQVIDILSGARSIVATDVDADGDPDVLCAAYDGIAWYENRDGLGNFGPQQVIAISTLHADAVFAVDLDGDGDEDVLSASHSLDRIAWQENDPLGLDDFGPAQPVSIQPAYAGDAIAADLDGDGDQDVLSTGYFPHEIAWYENLYGSGLFGPRIVVATLANAANSLFAADLNGDGDVDVLSACAGEDKIAWYENTNGLGAFGPQQVISTAADGANRVFVADLDGDGDADVLSASWSDDKIAWYENTNGLGTFGPQQVISTAADGANFVFAADLDGDGDQDVLSASGYDDKVAWYENTNGLGSFGPQNLISTAADGAGSVAAADVDGDGDADVLSASPNDDKIAWYENTNGLGSFGPQRVISTAVDGANSLCAADLDGDGDTDVLSASGVSGTTLWYENTDGLGSFGPLRCVFPFSYSAPRASAVDLNGDGNPEVLSNSGVDARVVWYENLMGPCERNMGYQGPGNVTLSVCGDPLYSGATADFLLTGAPPNALAILLASPFFTPTYVWEAGGTLCPIAPAFLVVVMLATDSQGEISFPNGVPGGNGPAYLYVQAVCQDVAQPMGWAVSNCVRIDLLP